ADRLVLPRQEMEKRGDGGSVERGGPRGPVRDIVATRILQAMQIVPVEELLALEPGNGPAQQEQRQGTEKKELLQHLGHVGLPGAGEISLPCITRGTATDKMKAPAAETAQAEESFMSATLWVRSNVSTCRFAAPRW